MGSPAGGCDADKEGLARGVGAARGAGGAEGGHSVRAHVEFESKV